MKKTITILLLLTLLLTSCAGKLKPDHVEVLVQGTLDTFYRSQYDPAFLKLVQATGEEAEAMHRGNLEAEARKFALYFNIEYLDENTAVREELLAFLDELLSRARYTVGEPTQLDVEVYTINVEVEPLDLLARVLADFDRVKQGYNDLYRGLTAEELEERKLETDEGWTRLILDLCREKLQETAYLPAETVVVSVERQSDGSRAIVEDTIYAVADLALNYPML